MARPAKKKSYWEAKKRRMGELQAEREFHRTKPLEESFKEHAGKIIDNFKIDPVETAAIIGLTYVVHETLMSNSTLKSGLVGIARGSAATLGDPLKLLVGGPMGWLFAMTAEAAGEAAAQAAGQPALTPLLEWVISFGLAYVLVRHAGQLFGLMKEGAGGLAGILAALMGVAA